MKKMVSPQNQFLTTSQMKKQISFTSQHLYIYYHTVFLKKNTRQPCENQCLPCLDASITCHRAPSKKASSRIHLWWRHPQASTLQKQRDCAPLLIQALVRYARLPKAVYKPSLTSCKEKGSVGIDMGMPLCQGLTYRSLLLPEEVQNSLWGSKTSTSSSKPLKFLLLKRLHTVPNPKELPKDNYNRLLPTTPS